MLLDESGKEITENPFVWTGLFYDGIASESDCLDWTSKSNNYEGGIGYTWFLSSWSYVGTNNCTLPSRLYCFQQECGSGW